MLAFLTLCYAGLIWLVFFKLKLLAWNRMSQITSVIVGLLGIFLLVVFMGLYQPQAVSATVTQRSVPIVARVSGRVIDVPVQANTPVQQGDVLLKIDPRPFEAEVARLRAARAEAEQAVPGLEAAWREAIAARAEATANRDFAAADLLETQDAFDKGAATDIELELAKATAASTQAAVERTMAAEERARIAYESEIDGVNTTVAQISAQLARAQIDLDECTIYAPADGIVTQRAVDVGAVTLTAPFASVMNFVYGDTPVVRAIFRSNARRHMKVGDEAEIVFDTVPGVVFRASVREITPATGAGTLNPSGNLLTTAELAGSDLVLAVLDVEDERFDRALVPTGTGASAAVYAEGAKPIRIIRRVVMRINAWMAYL